jgi:hypothetical protein
LGYKHIRLIQLDGDKAEVTDGDEEWQRINLLNCNVVGFCEIGKASSNSSSGV